MRLKEGYNCKEGRGTQPECQGCPGQTISHVVRAEDGGRGREYTQVGRGSQADATSIAVEVVTGRRVSQCSDIRQRSGESQLEIEIETDHHQ